MLYKFKGRNKLLKKSNKISGLYNGLAALIVVLSFSLIREYSVKYTPRADFDPSEATMFIWVEIFHKTQVPLLAELSAYDKIVLFTLNEKEKTRAIQLLEAQNAVMDNIQFERTPVSGLKKFIWMRDIGPMFLTRRNKMKIVDFKYYNRNLPFKAGKFDYFYGNKSKIESKRSKLISVGGSREFNGKGTVLLVESHERYYNRNFSKVEIEKEYKTLLGQKKIIWLKNGLPNDDDNITGPLYDSIFPSGANGHVDEFCRFANPNTILLCYIDSVEAEKEIAYKLARTRMLENLQILQQATDQNGKPFNIVLIPAAPNLLFKGGKQYNHKTCLAITSYLNFIVTNNTVIIAKYYNPGYPKSIKEKDEEVKKIFERLYPTKVILQHDPTHLNTSGGGFHCISLNIPKNKHL